MKWGKSMDERISLLQAGHQELVLDGETIRIGSLIGAGALCLAYDAVRLEVVRTGSEERTVYHRIVLKEFYPEKNVSEEQTERFLSSYSNAARLGGEERTAAFVSVPFKCVSDNGKLYLMYAYDPGKTAEAVFNDHDTINYTLYDLFSLLYQAAESVARLHDYDEKMQAHGSLHLDLTPSNLLMMEEEKVKLFDMDSFVPVGAVRDGTYQIACSDGYMAPEQALQWRTRIGPWTDVFAIGSIAYRYLFHRGLDYAWQDADGSYQIDGERIRELLEEHCYENELEQAALSLCESFPDNAVRLLKEFLRKTLAYHYKKRYRNLREVQAVLKQLMGYASCRTLYIPEHFQENQTPVFGLEAVYKELEQAFCQRRGNAPVFISGPGGCGKSTLAKEFAKRHLSEYQTIAEVYTDSFDQALMQIEIANDDPLAMRTYTADPERYLHHRAEKISRLFSKKRLLLIVHDYDQRQLKYLDILMKTKADILVTSRCEWSDSGYREVKMKPDMLSLPAAEKLFLYHYQAELNSEEREDLKKLLSYVDYHPLTIELLARQMSFFEGEEMRPKQMLDRLCKNGIGGDGETFVYGKDSRNYQEKAVWDHLESFFKSAVDHAQLNEEELDVLRVMILFGRNEVSAEEVGKWTGDYADKKVILEQLKKRGWLCKYKTKYRMLYPMAEVLQKHSAAMPDTENSAAFINTFYEKKLEDCQTFAQREHLLEIAHTLWKRICLCAGKEEVYCNLLEECASRLAAGKRAQEAVEIGLKLTALTTNTPEEAASEMRCGSLYYECEDYSNALIHYERAYEIWSAQTDRTEDIGMVCSWIGRTLLKLGNAAEARGYFLKEKSIWGEQKPSARFYDLLGRNSVFLGETEDAAVYYEKALQIRKSRESSAESPGLFPEIDFTNPLASREEVLKFGAKLTDSLAEDPLDESDRIIAEYSMLSRLEHELGNRKKALKYAKESLDLQLEWLGEEHLYLADSFRWIAQLYREGGRKREAQQYEGRAFAILKTVLGTEAEETKDCEAALQMLESESLFSGLKRTVKSTAGKYKVVLSAAVPALCLILLSYGVWYHALTGGQNPASIWWELELQKINSHIGRDILGLIVMLAAAAAVPNIWKKWIPRWQLVTAAAVFGLSWMDMGITASGVAALFWWQMIQRVCRDANMWVLYIPYGFVGLLALIPTALGSGMGEAAVILGVQLILEAGYRRPAISFRIWKYTAIAVSLIFAAACIDTGAAAPRMMLYAVLYICLLYGICKAAKYAKGRNEMQAARIVFWYLAIELVRAAAEGKLNALPLRGAYGETSLIFWLILGILCSLCRRKQNQNKINLLYETEKIEKQREELYRYMNSVY